MAAVTVTLEEEVGNLVAAMREAAAEAKRYGGENDKLDSSIESLQRQVKKLFSEQDKLGKQDKKITEGIKGKERAYDRAQKNEAEYTLTVNRTELAQKALAETTDRVTKVYGVSAEATAAIEKVTGQYAEILTDVGDNQGYLLNQWKRALPTSEKTARQLSELVAFSTDAERETTAYATSVTRLSQKLEKQLAKEARNAGRSLSDLFDELKDVTKEGQAQEEQIKDLAKAYDRQQKRADALEKAMTSLNVPGADIVKTFKDQSDSLKTLAENGSVAEVNLLKVGIAAGTAAAAAAAAAVGVAAGAAAIVGITASSAEWNRELEALGQNLDEVGTQKVERAEASIQAVGMASKAAATQLGAIFSPSVTDAGTRLVAATLALKDFFKEMDDGQSLLDKGARKVAEGVTAVQNAPKDGYEFLTGELPLKMIAAGVEFAGFSEEADQLRESFEGLSDITDEGLDEDIDAMGKAMAGAVREGVEPLTEATESYMDRARKLVDDQQALNRVVEHGGDAARSKADAVVAATEREAMALGAIAETEIDLLALRREARGEADAKRQADLESYIEASRQLQKEEMARVRAVAAAEKAAAAAKAQYLQANASLASQVAGQAVQLAQMVVDEQSKGYQILYGAAQLAAISTIAVDTIVGVNKAIASQQYVQAGLIAASGALSAGMVAANAYGQFSAMSGASKPTSGAGASTGATDTAKAAASTYGTDPSPVVGGTDSVPVSDAYMPAVGGPPRVTLTTGDEVYKDKSGTTVARGGEMGLQGSLEALLIEMRGLRSDNAKQSEMMSALITDSRLRQSSRQEVGPAPRRG